MTDGRHAAAAIVGGIVEVGASTSPVTVGFPLAVRARRTRVLSCRIRRGVGRAQTDASVDGTTQPRQLQLALPASLLSPGAPSRAPPLCPCSQRLRRASGTTMSIRSRSVAETTALGAAPAGFAFGGVLLLHRAYAGLTGTRLCVALAGSAFSVDLVGASALPSFANGPAVVSIRVDNLGRPGADARARCCRSHTALRRRSCV